MGLSSLEKAGLAIAGLYLGGTLAGTWWPETTFGMTGGMFGAAGGETGMLNFFGGAGGAGTGADLSGGTGSLGGNVPPADVGGQVLQEGGKNTGLWAGLTSPNALAGLFAAGATLGSTLLASEEKDEDREALKEENQAGREHQSSENALTREHNAAEAAKNRDHESGIAAKNREFQAEQAAKAAKLQAMLARANNRSALYNNRINSLGGGGRSLAANAANLSQSILR